MDNLKNSFRADPNYEIPANVFLQDMTQVIRVKESVVRVSSLIFRFRDCESMLRQIS